VDLFFDLRRKPAGARRYSRQDLAALFDKVYFHHSAANASDKFAIRTHSHFVTLSAGARTGAFGGDEKHDMFTSAQAVGDEMPKLAFFCHKCDCTLEEKLKISY
jgi:hypothetical protein